MTTNISMSTSTAADGAANAIQNLTQSALSSLEQFLSVVKIQKGHPPGAETPGFRSPDVSGEVGVFGDGAVGPTLHDLDPYFPQKVIDGDTDGTQFFVGNDYQIVANSKVTSTTGDFNVKKLDDLDPGSRAVIDWVQPMNALRGPIIVSGWGYGMDDLPVPQKGPNYPDNVTFDQKMPHDRALWKTGPVHLMWDDERQVWQGGYPIVCGVVDGAITAPVDVCNPTEFTVNLFRNTQHLGGKLSDVTAETITVQNRDPSLEQDATANAIFCMAIKLNYEWLPLWVGCPATPACGQEGQPPKPPCIENSTC